MESGWTSAVTANSFYLLLNGSPRKQNGETSMNPRSTLANLKQCPFQRTITISPYQHPEMCSAYRLYSCDISLRLESPWHFAQPHCRIPARPEVAHCIPRPKPIANAASKTNRLCRTYLRRSAGARTRGKVWRDQGKYHEITYVYKYIYIYYIIYIYIYVASKQN